MEAFSDGVFSIAATLLVFDLALHPPGSPLDQLLQAWPAYLGYVVSFLTIGGAWLAHNLMTDRLTHADSLLLRINLLLLLVVAFLPFPTRLVVDAFRDVHSERLFVSLYGATLLTIRLVGIALDGYARNAHLYAADRDTEEVEFQGRQVLPVVIGYMVAILVGLVLPALAVVAYLGLAVYLIVPFREVARWLRRRP
jgi:uncharacterized membrane protein